MVVEEIDEDPIRYLVLGADTAGKSLSSWLWIGPKAPW